jgi:hypothetical protein
MVRIFLRKAHLKHLHLTAKLQGVSSINCGLLSGAVSISDYVAPNDKVISERRIEKDMEVMT